jgi:hypothetical protein
MNKETSPISKDLVVACAIYHLHQDDKKATFSAIVEILKKKIDQMEIPDHLRSLSNWEIINIIYDYECGRIYSISPEAHNMIRELYELFWEKMIK